MNETEQKVYWVAFDVASEKMDVAAGISRWQKPTWTAQNIQNKEKELKKYLQKAKKQAEATGRPLRLACESTGVYHRLRTGCTASPKLNENRKRQILATPRSSCAMQ